MPTNLSFAVPTSSKLDTCEVTGFESRVREECEEVSEVECTPIEVKKIKTEIRDKCEVKLNKTCEVQFSPAPTEKCHPTTKRRSHHICLRSSPVDPDVVCLSVSPLVAMLKIMTD